MVVKSMIGLHTRMEPKAFSEDNKFFVPKIR